MDVLAFFGMRVLVVLFVVLSSALSACSSATERTGERPTLVAAFYPLAWAVERIGGGAVQVVNLTPPGAEPHDVELSPRDVEAIRDAELVVYIGGGFQPAVEDAVAGRDGPSLNLLRPDESDAHLWLDPIRFAGAVEKISQRLGRADSVHRLVTELHGLDAEYRRGLEDCERRTLVTAHAAFGRLAARYELTQLSLSGRSPEAEPSPRELERLVEQIRESGATTIFEEPLVSDRLTNTVAREAGAGVAVLDPIEGLSDERLDDGEDYLSVMRSNLETLEEALGCR